jgi:heme oxygenase
MSTDPDVQVWPDDARKAAVTLALAADVPCDLDSVITSIEDGVADRPVAYVLALIGALTAGLEDQFHNPTMVAAFQKTAAQYQAHEDDMRARGEWRREN